MKKQLICALAAVLLSAGYLCAQMSQSLSVTVPFDFQAGRAVLPAGHYKVQFIAPQTILLRCETGRGAAMVVMNYIESLEPNTTPKLIFNRYEEKYFLSQVWPYGKSGRVLLNDPAEKEAATLARAKATQTTVTARASK